MESINPITQLAESDWLAATLTGLERITESFALPAPRVIGFGKIVPAANGGYMTIFGEQISHIMGIAASDENSRKLVAQTFGYSATEVELSDIADAMGELANILVGSVKTLFSGRAGDLVAGLPWFLSGQLWVSSSEVTTATVLIGDIEVIVVIIRQQSSVDHLEQRRMEAAISDREARLRAILDSAVDGILTVDDKGQVESLNTAAQRILLRSEHDALGQSVDALFGIEVRGHLNRLSSTNVDGQGPHEVVELQTRRVNGDPISLELTAAPFCLRDQGMIVGIFRDVTSRKRLEVDLRQAQKLESVGRLAAGIAHEFNTPLQYVADNLSFIADAFAQLKPLFGLRERLTNNEAPPMTDAVRLASYEAEFAQLDFDGLCEVPAALTSSVEGLVRIASIVGAMKEFSRPSQGYLAPERLEELIGATVAVCRNEWEYVSDLVTEFDPTLPSVSCIRDELSHALLHVIVNATHAIEAVLASGSQQRGRITISTHRHEQWAEIRVSDNGCGIAEDVRPHIFEPFFTTKPVGKGAGQGLTIVHNVLLRHRGRIEIESIPGQLTTFRLFMPLTSASEAPPL